MMRLSDYVGASLVLLLMAGKLMACPPAPTGVSMLCNPPLDIVPEAGEFSIVPRQSSSTFRAVSMPTSDPKRVGSGVWFDARIKSLPYPATSQFPHQEIVQ